MKFRNSIAVLFPALLLTVTGVARANDTVSFSNPTAITNPLSLPPVVSGNQLTYTYVGTSFPCDDSTAFATFSFNWGVSVGNDTNIHNTPTYPGAFDLSQIGGDQITLTPSSSSTIAVPANNSTGSVTESVYIPTAGCSSLGTADGTTLVGHVKASLDTSSLNASDQILVKIVLKHPTACLGLYATASNQDTLDDLDSLVVVAPHSYVKATNPGTISVDGLVVNTCGIDKSFDIGVNLGQSWETQPTDNPGNAIFLFDSTGAVDLSNYALAAWGTGTPGGENTCISNVSLPTGHSMLARVHSQIVSGTAITALPANSFPFTVTLYQAGTGCKTALSDPVTPSNPASDSVSYTVKSK